ncbi:ABC transporter permease [Acidobacteria bacterium ACD]|nr:MAG: ABC transporter permease [Acidobacteriota bacterium]MCE7958021.1 ABC transporter permease [Acidobacteria bacterium ACB2]MDL1949545.1 ABC transporter permease [Acidobacteria bacterium ACD]
MKRLLALMKKEFLQLGRDRISLRMMVVIPIMQTLIFGYAINYDVKHLKTVVYDEARTFDSRELVAKLTASEYFDLVGSVASLAEARHELDAGHAVSALVIDKQYGRDRHRGAPAHAYLIVNASDTTTSTQAMSIASGIANQLSIQALARRAGWKEKLLPVDLRVRPWYNPELRTSTFVIPGLIGLILMFTLIQYTAIAIVRERERGTLEQLQVTPVTRLEIILGKIFPFVLIGIFQMSLIVGLMRFLFDIPVQGSVVQLYLAGALFIATVLALGMLLSTIAKTQMQAVQLSFIFLLPSVFLSGYVFPIDGMPRFFQLLTYLVPLKYFILLIRGIVLRGAGLLELWEPLVSLLVFASLLVAAAVARFKKTSD